MEILNYFVNNYPDKVQLMKDTDHGYKEGDVQHLNPFHGEGDVWTHTLMVYNFCKTKTGKIAALLHDLGKCYTRYHDVEKGRVSFHGHAGVSTVMATGILKSMELDGMISNNDVHSIILAINFHQSHFSYQGKTYDKFMKDIGLASYYDAKSVLNELFYADCKGRIGRMFEPIDMFADDSGIDGNYWGADLEKLAEDAQKPWIEILIGLPGSGKSRYVDRLLNPTAQLDFDPHCILVGTKATIISRDAFVEERGKGRSYDKKWASLSDTDQKQIDKDVIKQFQAAVKKKENIIVDMTNLSRKSRRKWFNGVKNYEIRYKRFMCGWEQLLSNNKERVGKNIPESVLLNMAKNMDLFLE